jgi:hypothetical protein
MLMLKTTKPCSGDNLKQRGQWKTGHGKTIRRINNVPHATNIKNMQQDKWEHVMSARDVGKWCHGGPKDNGGAKPNDLKATASESESI